MEAELDRHEGRLSGGSDYRTGETGVPEMLTQEIEWMTDRSPEDVRAARERILGTSPPAREIPEGKTIVDMVVGKWPGTETNAEIQEALDRIS